MENDSFDLLLFPLLSTVACNLNLVLGGPLVSYITNFPVKTMLVLMERREGQFCFLSKPHEGRNNVTFFLTHHKAKYMINPQEGFVEGKKAAQTAIQQLALSYQGTARTKKSHRQMAHRERKT